MKNTKLKLAAVSLALLLAGCGASATVEPQPTPAAALAPTAAPAVTEAPAATPEPIPPESYDQRDETFRARHNGTEVTVHATVTTPAEGAGWPLVVLCHGFTGSRGGDGHFGPLAARLAHAGIASIAMDFPGCGESEEPFTAYTLTNIRADMTAAIAYMGVTYGVDTTRLGLVGHSMGGRAVSLYLDGRDYPVTAAALWSPADNTGLDGLEFLAHDADERAALRQTADENGSVELPQWGVAAGAALFDEMAASDPCGVLAGYPGALLAAFTGGDAELLSEDTVALVQNTLATRDLPFVDMTNDFPDANHNYQAAEGSAVSDAEIAARIENATAEFLVSALR